METVLNELLQTYHIISFRPSDHLQYGTFFVFEALIFLGPTPVPCALYPVPCVLSCPVLS